MLLVEFPHSGKISCLWLKLCSSTMWTISLLNQCKPLLLPPSYAVSLQLGCCRSLPAVELTVWHLRPMCHPPMQAVHSDCMYKEKEETSYNLGTSETLKAFIFIIMANNSGKVCVYITPVILATLAFEQENRLIQDNSDYRLNESVFVVG